MLLIRCFRVLEWLNNSLRDENASSISVWWKRISKERLKFFKKLSEMKLVVVKKVRYQFTMKINEIKVQNQSALVSIAEA